MVLPVQNTISSPRYFAFCVVNVNSTVVFKQFEDLEHFERKTGYAMTPGLFLF